MAGGQPSIMKTKSLFPERQKRSLIQWPTERQVEEVSASLSRIVKVGMRWEAKGDYFASGDLAYQIQEIMRAIQELLKKSGRVKR
jgi:hypothetical protein